jgi:hypothetical protein
MDTETFSPQGESRRRQILQMAQGEARRRRNRRHIVRGTGLTAVAVVVALAVILPRHRPIAVHERLQPMAQLTPPVAEPSTTIVYVQSDPDITDRLTIKPQAPRWTNLSDRELLDELAAAGQPAGIVCMNGKTILLPR